jgi:hypothetical protein
MKNAINNITIIDGTSATTATWMLRFSLDLNIQINVVSFWRKGILDVNRIVREAYYDTPSRLRTDFFSDFS